MTSIRLSLVAVASLTLFTACSDATQTAPDLGSAAFGKLTGGGGGAGGGGGTVTPSIPNPLPTSAPAADVIYRESWGFADNYRPKGGKGTMTAMFLHQTIGGFWAEWPGSKNNSWQAPDGDQTWKFAACSLNDLQMPSPIDVPPFNGCIASEWFDAVTSYPTALLPFVAPSTAYEYSMDGWPAPIPGAYIALGFTSSPSLQSNLTTSGSLFLRMEYRISESAVLHYDLYAGGVNGTLLASGDEGYAGFNPMSLRYDPVAHTTTLRINGVTIGTYPVTIATPKYIAFEGVGVLDNLVVRK
jgi:hypothetical protein